ncbi:unnamed protein product [Haemonchus placei]|uniref:Recep_L_domain domain-containing protein n=1 Tax=Haemonchus placei TaxID=6290 RepID=A0A0N4WCD0_HAEPC|nr:unnamed protein product [Haemonchus placei]
MPRLEIQDPFSSEIVIWDNPQLDTSPVLNECKIKKCPDRLMEHIQMPFTCSYQLPIPEGCLNVYGDFDLTNFHESFDQVESIIGTMTLSSSNLTSFPKLKNLRAIRQRNDGPVIIIENNPELRDVKALYSLDVYTRNADNAVHVANNTNLCINFTDLDQKFPLHYLGYVDRCMIMTSFVLFVNSIHTDEETVEHTIDYRVDYSVEEPPLDAVPSSETGDSEQIAEFEPAESADESEWHSNLIEDPDSRELSPGTTDHDETAEFEPTKPANKFIEYQFTDGSRIAPCLLSICILAISFMINFI